MRWKAIFIEDTDENDRNEPEETYGLKSKNTPKQIQEMVNFEKDLIDMAQKIKFRAGTNGYERFSK